MHDFGFVSSTSIESLASSGDNLFILDLESNLMQFSIKKQKLVSRLSKISIGDGSKGMACTNEFLFTGDK